ncbi:MAG: ribonuclease E/G [Bacteroidetes bacterium B1(2017)]|nr:MAG: ribonuclease E/G [Bacteroidetes bacterium B1(2017)]
MNYELIINSNPSGGVDIAILKDKKLIELHHEKVDNSFQVGDVYLGTVGKIMPGLNAGFVNVGHEKDAFLHYLDLGPQFQSTQKFTRMLRSSRPKENSIQAQHLESDINKGGKITDLLKRNQQILVQVTKEPISNKGPRLTCELSLAGRFLVMMPFDNSISISKKIVKQDERRRLKEAVNAIKPENFGVIIRTNAEGESIDDLQSDLKDLMSKWDGMCKQLKEANSPQKVLGENDRTLTMVRDLVNETYTNIQINDNFLYTKIKSYLNNKSPELESIVKFYNGKLPIFEQFGIEKQIKTSFGKEVNFMGGSYLIIEHTEALHVIDVNSGNTSNKGENQEENALKVNMEAVEEIARQLRLRDLGGIIVIDLIDLKTAGNRKLVYEKLKEVMKTDRAKHKILPMSPFGLIQITRQRVRPEMAVVTNEKCPTCMGSGEIQSSVSIVDDIDSHVKYLIENLSLKGFCIEVHPYLAAFLKDGWFKSPRFKWWRAYKQWIKVTPNNSLHLVDYKFIDAKGEEVVL